MRYLTPALAALALTAAFPLHADSLYLFVGDRAPDATRTGGIHRYKIDTSASTPAVEAPSVGQTGSLWGDTKGKPYQGMRLTDAAIGPDGDVYVVSRDNNNVIRFDGKTGADKGVVVSGLNNPDGLTIGPDGNIYVTSNMSIVRVKTDGTPLPGAEQVGNIFATGGRLQAASGLTFGPDGNLYVSSQATAQVIRYDGRNGQLIDVFCSSGILSPSELAFGPDGNLYIASTAGPTKMSPDDGYILKVDGRTGLPIGKFGDAKAAIGLVFGDKNDLYASNYWDGLVTRYDLTTGKSLGVVASNPAGGSLYYLALARQEDAAGTGLKPVTVKLPARPSNAAKTSPVNYGADTVKGWKNALKPKGTPGPLLNLATAKKTDYIISLAAKPSTADEKAAAILARWLNDMTGATFPIVKEGTPSKAKTLGKVISVGRTQLLQKSGLKEASLDLANEGYAIAAKGGNLFLFGGRTRGAIYAVYSLLEEDLGCRWYTGGNGFRIPRVATLSFKPTLRHKVPLLDVRDPLYAETFDTDWSLRNKTNASQAYVPQEWGGNSRSVLFVHTYNALVPPETYFKEHPEYYAEIGGQRTPSQLDLSNPDVLRITIESARKFLKADPGAKIISISPNDGRGYCECPICSALDKAEATAPNSKTGSLINFVNKVAAALEPEFPDVKFSTLAYLDTFMPPKTLRPRKNVVIQLCTDSHAWRYQFYYITESTEFQEAMKAWHAINADIHIWDYPVSYVNYMVPMPNMPVVSENMRFFMDNGAKGIMEQGNNNSPGAENALMRSWVWTKQMWDPSLDTRTLMRDFIYGYHGSAAEPIWNYNMMLWNLWEKYHQTPVQLGTTPFGATRILPYSPCSAGPDWDFFDKTFMERTTAYFDQAEKLAKDPETLRRVKIARLPLLYLQLGQGLGYVTEFGDFKAGSWGKTLDPAQKPYYERLLKEFSETAGSIGATFMSERVSLTQLTGKWQEMLTKKWEVMPTIGLGPNWKFKTDADNTGLANGYNLPETSEAGWNDLSTSGNYGWESQGFADYRGTAWYRTRFTVPADFQNNKYLYFYFGAIDRDAEIYINGVKAFEHSVASTGKTAEQIWNEPFMFDPRPFLKFGAENTIAIKITSSGGIRGIWKQVRIVGNDKETPLPEIADSLVRLG